MLPCFRPLALLLLGALCGLRAQGIPEPELKAQLIYNLLTFVRWPAPPGQAPSPSLTLVVVGEHPFEGALDAALAGKSRQGRDTKILYSRKTQDADKGDILFISASEKGHLKEILDKVRDKPVLTIGDSEGFSQEGVIVNLFKTDNKIWMEVNREAGRRAGLDFHSMLLHIAKVRG